MTALHNESARVVQLGSTEDVFRGGDRAVVTTIDGDRLADPVLLVRGRHGRVFGMVNRCPHLHRALDDATVRGHVLTCHGHGVSFDLRTGAAARRGVPPLRLVSAWIDNGQVCVRVGS
jgi:nitrite reductase/ring-hydroxylating ferredoxin subunit